jgi:hypothetical protein
LSFAAYLRYTDSTRPSTPTSFVDAETVAAAFPWSDPSSQIHAAELLDRDHDNSDTGSHTGSDELEIPWFDSDVTDPNTSTSLKQNLSTETDYCGPKPPIGDGSLSFKIDRASPPSLNMTAPMHAPSRVKTAHSQDHVAVVTNSTSPEYETDSDDDSWCPEKISVDKNEKKKEATQLQDVAFVAQNQRKILSQVHERPLPIVNHSKLDVLHNPLDQHSLSIIPQTLRRSPVSEPCSLQDRHLSEAESFLTALLGVTVSYFIICIKSDLPSFIETKATDGGFGSESHMDLPKVYMVNRPFAVCRLSMRVSCCFLRIWCRYSDKRSRKSGPVDNAQSNYIFHLSSSIIPLTQPAIRILYKHMWSKSKPTARSKD